MTISTSSSNKVRILLIQLVNLLLVRLIPFSLKKGEAHVTIYSSLYVKIPTSPKLSASLASLPNTLDISTSVFIPCFFKAFQKPKKAYIKIIPTIKAATMNMYSFFKNNRSDSMPPKTRPVMHRLRHFSNCFI